MLARRHLEKTMYDFKNSFSPDFICIHRAKYIFSKDMFCLPHFWTKIHGVSYVFHFVKRSTIQILLVGYSQCTTSPVYAMDMLIKILQFRFWSFRWALSQHRIKIITYKIWSFEIWMVMFKHYFDHPINAVKFKKHFVYFSSLEIFLEVFVLVNL